MALRDALTTATQALRAYQDICFANILRSDKGWLLRTLKGQRFQPIDTKALRAALAVAENGQPAHIVIVRYKTSGEFDPYGLSVLYRLHTAITHANGLLLLFKNRPLSQANSQLIRRKWVEIWADSLFLAELIRHAYDVSMSAGPALQFRIGVRREQPVAGLLERLDKLNRDHKERLLMLVQKTARGKHGAAAALATRLGGYAPVELPGVRTFPDNPEARTVNDVWLPPVYAKPMMAKLAMEQAKAPFQSMTKLG